jgi:hypothetical protein
MKWIPVFLLFLICYTGWNQFKKESSTHIPTDYVSNEGAYAPVVILELFTSEGCSSCPPADNLLSQFSAMNNSVIPLSLHVDYWNRLGWTDRFSNREFSDRQRAYAKQFHLNSIYTPQLVVNGTYEMTGSNKEAAVSAIKKCLQENASVKLDLLPDKITGNKIKFHVTTQGETANMYLSAALVQKHAETRVTAGENKNAVLSHTNVVRLLKSVPAAKKCEFEMDIPTDITDWYLVVYAQQKDDLKIKGGILFQPDNY